MNFKKFNNIGDSDPRPWNRSVGTRFDEGEDDEIPVPYCDEFDEEEDVDEEPEDEIEADETETETESITSVGSKKNQKKNIKQTICSIILQEETDFMPE